MKKGLFYLFFMLGLLGMISPAAFATNGDNLIGIGPISRAMGGVGVAAPQEAIKEVSLGNMASLESSLSENSYSFGLTWRF